METNIQRVVERRKPNVLNNRGMCSGKSCAEDVYNRTARCSQAKHLCTLKMAQFSH